jgi:hypothetical protein
MRRSQRFVKPRLRTIRIALERRFPAVAICAAHLAFFHLGAQLRDRYAVVDHAADA